MTQRMYPLRKVGNVTFRNLLCNCKVKNLFYMIKHMNHLARTLLGCLMLLCTTMVYAQHAQFKGQVIDQEESAGWCDRCSERSQ